ncbi:MAG: hypothetical protein ACOX8H_05200 [Ruminococcus sp.]|jgi:uncharacterized membrane protein
MKITELLKTAGYHICIICSIVLLATQVLDWFNPYMDFLGHSMFILDLLCISSICLGVNKIFKKSLGRRKRKCWK